MAKHCSNDTNSSAKSSAVLKYILSFQFVVCRRITIFAVTLSLSNKLQSKQVDIASALSHATKVIETLKTLRSATEDGFKKMTHKRWQQIWLSISHVRELWVARFTETTSLQAIQMSLFAANNLHFILGKYHFWPNRPIWWSPEENDENHTFVKSNFSIQLKLLLPTWHRQSVYRTRAGHIVSAIIHVDTQVFLVCQ